MLMEILTESSFQMVAFLSAKLLETKVQVFEIQGSG